MSPPDAPSPQPAPSSSHWFWFVVCSLLLGVWFLNPTNAVLDMTLDTSNYSSYAHFTAQGFHYGREVVPMVGPYGFINYGFAFNDELYHQRIVLELLVKAAFGGLILWFFRAARPGLLRWLWLGAILVAGLMIEDTSYDLCILLGGCFLLLRFDRSPRVGGSCAVAAFMALLSLCKGTQVTLALATLGLVAIEAALTGRYRRGLAVIGSYVGAYLALWLLAGQSLADIPGFLRGIQELSSGYNNAMGLEEARSVTVLGLSLGGLLLLITALAAWMERRHRSVVLACGFFAAFALVQWKHGFVRGDGHVFIFFHFALIGALMPVLLRPEGPEAPPRWRRALAVLALLTFGFAAYRFNTVHPLRTLPGTLATSFGARVRQLNHPDLVRAGLRSRLEANRQKFALPLLRQKIGSGGVDFFGSEHGFIPLNQLRYQPRPVSGGSFNVYTEYLKGLNEAFLLDPKRRPDFYLVKGQTLDDRLLTQDDSRALLPLLYLYHPIATERDILLLAQRPQATPPAPAVEITRQKFAWGETVRVPALPASSTDLVLVSFEFKPTLLGSLRAFFYKPPQIHLALVGDPAATRQGVRIIPEMVRSPVILSPVIDNSLDLLELYTSGPGKRVREFRVTSDHAELYRDDALAVTFYRQPRPPADAQAGPLAAGTRMAVANAPVESADPVTFPHYMPQGFVVGMHAPSQAVMAMDGTERELTLEYGIEPGAYLDGGRTDGVDFIVELTQPGLPLQLLFHRYLNPLAAEGDRGTQTQRVLMPPLHPGAKVILRTHPGPKYEISWDWAYFAKVEFSRGALNAAQFPGFSRAPTVVDAAYCGPVDKGDRWVFMLNAPGALGFDLDGKERTLTFAGGLLPGAYTDKGNSDGATFIVELKTAGGETQALFSRTLNPRANASERGLQTFTVDLPAHRPGARLTVRTDPGPANEPSWDWTYVADLKFK